MYAEGSCCAEEVLEDLRKRILLLQTLSESENSVYPGLDERSVPDPEQRPVSEK